jgi:hypothetical protein
MKYTVRVDVTGDDTVWVCYGSDNPEGYPLHVDIK